jgi:hypothetical protein
MKRLSITFAALMGGLALTSSAFAQARTAPQKDAKPAVATAPAPVSAELMKARMRPAITGTASIEFIASPPKVVNGEVQSVIKVKNVDTAPIVGLKIDEYFYAGQKEVSACSASVRHPIAAGEIVDVPVNCPNPKERATGNNLMFSHHMGGAKVHPTAVKKFSEDTKKK